MKNFRKFLCRLKDFEKLNKTLSGILFLEIHWSIIISSILQGHLHLTFDNSFKQNYVHLSWKLERNSETDNPFYVIII